jgi:hypothetical protein
MTKKESIELKFMHENKPVTFKAEVNQLNNNWMYTFNDWQSCYSTDSKRTINQIIKNIKKNSEVIN